MLSVPSPQMYNSIISCRIISTMYYIFFYAYIVFLFVLIPEPLPTTILIQMISAIGGIISPCHSQLTQEDWQKYS